MRQKGVFLSFIIRYFSSTSRQTPSRGTNSSFTCWTTVDINLKPPRCAFYLLCLVPIFRLFLQVFFVIYFSLFFLFTRDFALDVNHFKSAKKLNKNTPEFFYEGSQMRTENIVVCNVCGQKKHGKRKRRIRPRSQKRRRGRYLHGVHP